MNLFNCNTVYFLVVFYVFKMTEQSPNKHLTFECIGAPNSSISSLVCLGIALGLICFFGLVKALLNL